MRDRAGEEYLNNIVFHSEERILLRALFAEPRLGNLYALHEQFMLSPAQLINSINKLVLCGLVVFDGDTVVLKKAGRAWIIKHRKKLFFENTEPYWQMPRSELKLAGSSSRNGRPYRIRMKKLDKSLLKRLE